MREKKTQKERGKRVKGKEEREKDVFRMIGERGRERERERKWELVRGIGGERDRVIGERE